jgi:hypothetical protein
LYAFAFVDTFIQQNTTGKEGLDRSREGDSMKILGASRVVQGRAGAEEKRRGGGEEKQAGRLP